MRLRERWDALEIAVRSRVRLWLFGEESAKLLKLLHLADNLTRVCAQGIHHDATIIAALARIEAWEGRHEHDGEVIAGALDIQIHKLQGLQVAICDEQRRLANLLEPVAAHARIPRPRLMSFDQVLVEGLKDLEE